MYQWAQNMTHIFVQISFPTTASTPPCDNILHSHYSATYNSIHLRLVCLHQGTYLLDYTLHVLTFKALNFNHAHWHHDGQNTIVLECMKSPAPYFWPILHSREQPPERRPKTWWKILERYQNSLKTVIDKLELEEGETDRTTTIKNKKKRQEDHSDSYSEISFYCYQGSPRYLGSWL